MAKDGITTLELKDVKFGLTDDIYEFLEQIGVKTISFNDSKRKEVKYTYTFTCANFDNRIYIFDAELSAIPSGGVLQFAAVKLMKEMNWTNGNESLRWYDR